MGRIRSMVLGVAALLCAAASVGAQEAGTPVDTARRLARLDTLRVTAAPVVHRYDHTGFDEREKRRGFGFFMTEASIKRRKLSSMSMLLANVPGLTVVRTRYGARIESRGMADFYRYCEPSVYLDGSVVTDGATIIGNVIRPDEVRGIEVYLQQGSAPPQYDRSPCGTVLIWSKLPDFDGADADTATSPKSP